MAQNEEPITVGMVLRYLKAESDKSHKSINPTTGDFTPVSAKLVKITDPYIARAEHVGYEEAEVMGWKNP